MNSGSVKLFTIVGIPVDINATWLLAFALITWSFSTSWFPALAELPSTAHYWIAGVLGTLALFTSVLAHELGHSLVALSQGLRVRGITLLLFGGVSRIEGGATRARNEFLIAFAGPAVSIVIGLVLWVSVFVLEIPREVGILRVVLIAVSVSNLMLGAFNLLPGYPLDGGRVLRSLVWAVTGSSALASSVAYHVGRVVFFIFIGLGAWQIINGDTLSGIWLAVIGFFLMSSARSERDAQSTEASAAVGALGFPVEVATEPMPPAIDEARTVQSVIDELGTESDQISLPVTRAGELVGFVTPAELSLVDPELRSISKISQVMDPRSLRVIDSAESAAEALRLLDLHRVSQLVVMGSGIVLGFTNRQSILKKMLEMQSARETYTRSNPADDID